MRDPARIARIISMLHVYWITNPDLRLGQLMINMNRFERWMEDDADTVNRLWNTEDTEWEEIFRKALKERT